MQKSEYKVHAYLPKLKGCGTQDLGWDPFRCEDFQNFLNRHATEGWRLHSSDYRRVTAQGCGGRNGQWLVCIFERISS